MATQFTSAEWGRIRQALAADPVRYGLPRREYGSVSRLNAGSERNHRVGGHAANLTSG